MNFSIFRIPRKNLKLKYRVPREIEQFKNSSTLLKSQTMLNAQNQKIRIIVKKSGLGVQKFGCSLTHESKEQIFFNNSRNIII
ncbi:hypothetical protein BpHYR1_019229 [Brachionus plicatilis]|uniref:Uncharacterized protein n=1 Tax=Brachionus plicatilis TaxID=10195 RepID=A0A3M7QGZ1_BRAPC|nr:hypothetical protein BpHYR1_019229 [Brachionus plicatilis]